MIQLVESSNNETPENALNNRCFSNLIDEWLIAKKTGLKMSSYVRYLNLINNHIKPSLGSYRAKDITQELINEYISDKLKVDSFSSFKGLSVKTVKNIKTIILSVLHFAKDNSLLPEAFNIHINLPREHQKELRVLSKVEQYTLERYLCIDLDVKKLGIILCLYTGLRIGEVCALKWSDISLSNNSITIKRTMQRLQTMDGNNSAKTAVFVTEPKSAFSLRTIPFPDCLLKNIKQFRPDCHDSYFLTCDVNKFIEPRTYQYCFKSYITNSGLRAANFHCTRHTFATRCVELGFDIKSLSEILGHANVNITLNLYVHPSFELKRQNMNKLSCLF